MEFNLFTILDVLGTVAFAISGALSAMNRRLDVFGIFCIAFVTAVGGGTLRDMLIGNTPVTWMQHTTYIYIIIIATAVAIVFRNQLDYVKKSLFLFDTIGLGIFTIIGVEVGISNQLSAIVSIALGAITGAFGGLIRDILCNEIPVIFRKEDIYVTPCLIGGLIFVVMHNYGINIDVCYIITSVTVIAIRIAAVKYHITLPNFYPPEQKE